MTDDPIIDTSTPEGQVPEAESPQPESLDEMRKRLEREIKDRRDANREAQTLRKQLDEIRKAEMSEVERLKVELDEMRTRVAQAESGRKSAEAIAVASRLGAAHPELIPRIIDLDEDGDIEAKVAAALTQYPSLKGLKVAQTLPPTQNGNGQADAEERKAVEDAIALLGPLAPKR